MGQYSQLLFVLLLVAVFWFVAIRPQQQRAKQQKAMLDALKPGDEVVTIGGVYATVVEVGERVRVRVFDGTEVEFAPPAISRVLPVREAAQGDTPGDDVAIQAEDSGETPADESEAELDA
jgi:preprotein translocase subunit YajC